MRGVIEGFYGPPWTHDARIGLIEFIGEHAMNAYVYAPKSDPKHRDRWREPYDETERAHFGALVRRGTGCGVRFGFAISPGLDIAYDDGIDRDALLAKLVPLCDLGVEWFVLALDDIPPRPGLGVEQARLCTWLVDALRSRAEGAEVTLVPTEYVGTRTSPYLRDLTEGIPAGVDLAWTGSTVCSPTITGSDARARAAATGGRRPLVWDNYPVNDGPMERCLHLGPYTGRDAALTDEVAGVLCNPMIQPEASKVALATAAEFLADPTAYDAAASWRRAVATVGAERAPTLHALARVCSDSPLAAPPSTEPHRVVDAIETAADPPARADRAAELRPLLRDLSEAPAAWPEAAGDALRAEVAPWLDQAAREAGAALAAVGLLEELGAPDPEAEPLMIHAFATVFSWSAARAHGDRVTFGPRFAVYPAVVQLADGSPALAPDLALVEDASAVDRLCRIALRDYARWVAAR